MRHLPRAPGTSRLRRCSPHASAVLAPRTRSGLGRKGQRVSATADGGQPLAPDAERPEQVGDVCVAGARQACAQTSACRGAPTAQAESALARRWRDATLRRHLDDVVQQRRRGDVGAGAGADEALRRRRPRRCTMPLVTPRHARQRMPCRHERRPTRTRGSPPSAHAARRDRTYAAAEAARSRRRRRASIASSGVARNLDADTSRLPNRRTRIASFSRRVGAADVQSADPAPQAEALRVGQRGVEADAATTSPSGSSSRCR